MQYSEIVQEALDITGRYDKQAYAERVTNALCKQIAQLLDNPLDLQEEQLAVDGTATIHNIQLQPDFLKVAYLRPLPHNILLQPITPNEGILDGRELVNVYYRSQNILIVRLGAYYKTDTLAYGWYKAPTALVAGTDSNWITTDYPDLLINLLAARIFTITGDRDSAQDMERSAALQLQQLQNLVPGGVSGILGAQSVR